MSSIEGNSALSPASSRHSKKRKFFTLKSLGWTLVLISVMYRCYCLYDELTDDFRLANIQDELPFRSEYEVETPTEEQQLMLRQILDQEFHYLGKGGQTYAFTSDDGKYVLKLFKFKHHRPRLLAKILPPIGPLKQIKEKHFAKAHWKFHAPFKGYKLAYDLHRQESALLFIHLNKTYDFLPTITVTDKLAFRRTIELDSYAFAIQRKGESFEAHLSKQLDANDLESARETIVKMIGLFSLEYDKGLFDQDFCVMRNTGFVDDQPIRIDVGQLCPNAHERSRTEHLAIVVDKTSAYLSEHYPEYHDLLLQNIAVKR